MLIASHQLLESCWKVYEILIEMHAIQALVTIPGPLLLRLVTVSILVLKVCALLHSPPLYELTSY